MKEVLFIQFYTASEYPSWNNLGNGFSSTFDLCKSKGSFYWVESNKDKIKEIELPIKKGTVFISCLFYIHLLQVYEWTLKYPNIKFIVGGPVISCITIVDKLPKNLIITNKTVEEWFNISNFSYNWKLILPDNLINSKSIYYTYTIDDGCYWNSCIYCSYLKNKKNNSYSRIKKNLKFEFKELDFKGYQNIRIGADAVKPNLLKPLILNLPFIEKNNGYRIFLRATKNEYKQLKDIKKLTKRNDIIYNIGIEFPSNRMWKHMNKGYIKSDVLDILNLLKTKVKLSFLVGWNNLKTQDLIELEDFLKLMPKDETGKNIISINKLFAIPNTPIHKTYSVSKKIFIGPFYFGFYPKLDEKQYHLNLKANQILTEYAEQKNYSII